MTGRRYRLGAAAAAVGVVLSGAAATGTANTARSMRSDSTTTAPVHRWQTGPRRWGGTVIQSLDPAPVEEAPALAAVSGSLAPAAARDRDQVTVWPRSQVLSNESTFTRWAYVDEIAPIHGQPNGSSAVLARLHWNTEDGFPEIYLLLRASWDAQGREWIELRIPGRPNGRTGWVQRAALGAFHLTDQLLVVNREQLRMYFYIDGGLRWSAPVAVGKPSTPTPPGRFWIRERFAIDDPQSGYWPYAFGTSDYSTLTDWPGGGVVGIHGPYYEPQLIPGRISHGCIRLRVGDDEWLAQHLGLGTPVRVL